MNIDFAFKVWKIGLMEIKNFLWNEAHYKVHWRFKEQWQFNTGLSYRFQSYAFKAIDAVTSQNLNTESTTADVSLGLGGAYLF